MNRAVVDSIPGSQLEIAQISNYGAIYINNKESQYGRLVCDECGLELRLGLRGCPEYLQKHLTPLPVDEKDEIRVEKYYRTSKCNMKHPNRDLIINTEGNVAALVTMCGGGCMEQLMAKELIRLLMIVNKEKTTIFWSKPHEFEAALAHTVKQNRDHLKKLFFPVQVEDQVIIDFCLDKVLDVIDHHTVIRNGMEQARHEYREAEIRLHLNDLVYQFVPCRSERDKVMRSGMKIVSFVIENGLGKERSSELIACSILCAACDTIQVPQPLIEMISRHVNVKSGIILGLKTEIVDQIKHHKVTLQ